MYDCISTNFCHSPEAINEPLISTIRHAVSTSSNASTGWADITWLILMNSGKVSYK